MSSLPVHSELLRVKAYETDFHNRWKPHCLQQALQEAAKNHAAELGFGYEAMGERGLAWVLSRLRIHFHEMPAMGAEVELRTWPKGVQQRLFFTRDFSLRSAGRALAEATSAWVLVDLAKRRVLPPAALPGALPFHFEDAIPELLEKISPPEGLPLLGGFQAGYSAIDAMGHANSARYLEWLLDCFPFESYAQRRLSRLQLNYSGEVKPGETVDLAAGEVDGRWLAQGVIRSSANGSGGARAFEADFAWEALEA